MKRKRGIIFADTWDKLNLKAIGYYHDHCYHLYRGLTADIMDNYEYKELMVDSKKYCLIYEEDIPYNPNENE